MGAKLALLTQQRGGGGRNMGAKLALLTQQSRVV